MAGTGKHRVICLAGPTGAGKTALALELATTLGCEVINADSRQTYHDFPIITAQPSLEEQRVCPHRLYGYLATSEQSDAADWVARACREMEAVEARGKIPLLVGGTGFYFQILLHGIADIPPIPQPIRDKLAKELAECGSPAMHATLSQCDPDIAKRLHPNDKQRILRALEVFRATGRPLSAWHADGKDAATCEGPLFVANTSLAELEPRLLARIHAMLKAGALDEAQRAMDSCPDPQAPGWSGIGCQEARAHLEGRLNRSAMIEAWQKNTRAYAKRQITWFRGRPESCWIDPAKSEAALRLAKEALGM